MRRRNAQKENLMFINTHKESKVAARIAAKFGFETLIAKSFYKRYTSNVFSPWSNERDARDAQKEIAEALREIRA